MAKHKSRKEVKAAAAEAAAASPPPSPTKPSSASEGGGRREPLLSMLAPHCVLGRDFRIEALRRRAGSYVHVLMRLAGPTFGP